MRDLTHPVPGRPDPGAAGALLARLFEQHGRTVYGLCRLLLRDQDEAEDAAQQTFLSAYRALRGGVVPRDGGAWLATIARNECRNRVRTRMREPLVFEAHVSATESLEETAARSQQIAELKAALLELPEKQREAVLLRDVYGLRYGEIAAALGATRPAVEALLFRARRRLQGRLRPLRDAAAALLVPAPLRDALAEAIPGFTTGGGAAAGAVAGVTAAKLAAATLLVGTAGTTVAVVGSDERRHHAPRSATPVAVADVAAPLRDPPQRAVIEAVPVATRVHPKLTRHKNEDEHAARARSDRSGPWHDDDDENDEREEQRGNARGPGSANDHSEQKRGRKAKLEDVDRSGPSRAGDDDHEKDERGDDRDEDEDEDEEEDEGG